jgi:hypothetical protein
MKFVLLLLTALIIGLAEASPIPLMVTTPVTPLSGY